MKISTRWFRDRIKESPYKSQRQLAFAIGLDPAALSYVLSGRRRLQIGEAEDLARALSVPLADVLTHAGVKDAERSPEPYPNIPTDIKNSLARISKKDVVWEVIRAVLKARK